MYSTCLFCHGRLGANDVVEQFPVGRRLAFDWLKGRLWVVCRRCERWNLAPLEERWEAIETCERRFQETRLRFSTANIGLARLREGLELVRIGNPLRPELAAWRFGDQFGRRRRRAALLTGTGLTSAATILLGGVAGWVLPVGAAAAVALWSGAEDLPLVGGGRRIVCRVAVGQGDLAFVRRQDLAEARVLAGGAWRDRWGLYVRYAHGSAIHLGVEALRVAGILLARINRRGAPPAAVQGAVDILERNGDAAHCFRYATQRPEHDRFRLSRFPVEYRLALEMAAHEETERRAMAGELALLERAWRQAELIAGIADELLLPPGAESYVRSHRPV